MALAFHSSILCSPVPRSMARPSNVSLTAWEFAEKVVAYALDRGRKVAVYQHEGGIHMVLHGTPRYEKVVASRKLVGVYDADCLVRDLRDDVKEYFKC